MPEDKKKKTTTKSFVSDDQLGENAGTDYRRDTQDNTTKSKEKKKS